MTQGNLVDKALKNLGDKFPEIAWTTGIATLLISPVIIIGNGLVLASILLDPFKNIRSSPSSNLIFSLALADFLMGILTDPLAAIWHIYIAANNTQPFSVNTIQVPATIFVGVSLYSLVALSADRRIAITTPLQYAYRVTKKKIRIAIVCIWCYFVIGGTLWTVLHSFKLILDIIIAAHFAVASIILAVLNVAVIRSVRNQALNIKKTVNPANLVVIQNAFNRERAVTQTIIMMEVAFEICLWPFVILSSIANRMLEVTDLHDYKTFLWMYFMSDVLLLANSLMNPFLYAWRLPKYRKAFRYILIQLKNKLFLSKVQTQSNSSRQLSTNEAKYNTPVYLNLPSIENHDHYLKITRQQAVCSSACNEIDVQEHVCIEGRHSIVNTRL